MKGRTPTKAEQEHMDRVRDIGCAICWREHNIYSPAAIHHVRGKTQPGAHFQVIGLCGAHHQGGYGIGFHAGRRTWEEKFGTQAELLAWVAERLG